MEVKIVFAHGAKPAENGYADKMELLYDALSEYLGGMELEPAMLGYEGGLETYLYLDADATPKRPRRGRSGCSRRPPGGPGGRA